MIPYAAIPYFGPLSGSPAAGDSLSLTGPGTGYWQKVYLCNGQNGTPDLRGRTLVGVTTGMGGSAYDPEVDPYIVGNPNYTISGGGSTVSKYGVNTVTLNLGQIPSHNHTATVTTAPDHAHYMAVEGSQTTNNDNSLYDGTAVGREDLGLSTRAYNQASDNFDYELVTSSGTPDAGKTSENGSHTHDVTISSVGGGGSHTNVQPSRASYYIMYIP